MWVCFISNTNYYGFDALIEEVVGGGGGGGGGGWGGGECGLKRDECL